MSNSLGLAGQIHTMGLLMRQTTHLQQWGKRASINPYMLIIYLGQPAWAGGKSPTEISTGYLVSGQPACTGLTASPLTSP